MASHSKNILLVPILPDLSVAGAVSCRRKSGAGVVAACSQEGGLSRVGSSSPAEPSDECPAKTVYRTRPREAPSTSLQQPSRRADRPTARLDLSRRHQYDDRAGSLATLLDKRTA